MRTIGLWLVLVCTVPTLLSVACSRCEPVSGKRAAREDVSGKMMVLDHVNLFLERFRKGGDEEGMRMLEDALDVAIHDVWDRQQYLTPEERIRMEMALAHAKAYRTTYPRQYSAHAANRQFQEEVDKILTCVSVSQKP